MASILSTECINVEFGPNEPWPSDVKLYQPLPETQILPLDLAHSLSTQAFLKMSNLNFTVESRKNAEHMSPSGQLPFITVGAYVISEVDPIIGFVNTKVLTDSSIPDDLQVDFEKQAEEGYFTGHKLSEGFSNGQNADMRAFMSLTEKILSCAELFATWMDPVAYSNVTLARYGSAYSWPLSHLLTYKKYRKVRNFLKAKGWLNLTDEQRHDEVASCCQALEERLGKDKYFFKDKPTELDALVYGHLSAILTDMWSHNFGSEWANLLGTVEAHPMLVQFVKNISQEYMAVAGDGVVSAGGDN